MGHTPRDSYCRPAATPTCHIQRLQTITTHHIYVIDVCSWAVLLQQGIQSLHVGWHSISLTAILSQWITGDCACAGPIIWLESIDDATEIASPFYELLYEVVSVKTSDSPSSDQRAICKAIMTVTGGLRDFKYSHGLKNGLDTKTDRLTGNKFGSDWK
jgi:hypothetical protein